jgi:uncharacterized membrane protein YebE (DUF533 family)
MTEAENTQSVVAETPSERPASDAGKSASNFAREHPVLLIAGGIAVGAVIAALLPRGTTRRLAKGAAGLAEIASVAGIAFGRDALERAAHASETARDKAGHFGDSARDSAGRIARKASEIGTKARARLTDRT